MTTTALPQRRSDNLIQRCLRSRGDRACTGASSHQRSQPATAISSDNRHHQAGPRSPVGRISNRIESRRAHALAPSVSTKSP